MKSWKPIQKAVIALTIAYACVFVGMLIVRPGSKQFYQAFFNTYQIIPPLFASICGFFCYRLGLHMVPIRRVGWLVIAFACLSFATGQATWTYFESIRGIEVPFPSLADVGYLSNYVFLIAGVLLLFGSMPVAGRARQLLDNAIAASSLGVLSWYFLVERLWTQSDVSLVGKCISVAYPLGDIAALFGAVVLLSTANPNRVLRRSVYFLATGIVLFTFFDTSFTWMSLNGTYRTGSWSDWTVSFGWLMIGYAFLTRFWWVDPKRQEATPDASQSASTGLRSMRQIIAPYLAVTVACAIIGVHDYAGDGNIEDTSVALWMFLMVLVVIRQILTLAENRSLTVELKAFSDNLEVMVAQRTEQLTALHDLTKAVSVSLRPDDVLKAAQEHTKAALCADAVVVWLAEDPRQESESPHGETVRLHEGFEQDPEMLEFLSHQPARDVLHTLSLTTAPHRGDGMSGVCLRAPLRWQHSVVGSIGVVRWNADFGVTECQLLESIGIEVGTALENARMYSAAIEAADIDSVTGLFNHRAIHQRLDRAIQQAKRQDQKLSLIMMDMDNFKLFNDTYGHPVGDQVLKEVGKVLRDVCRDKDILGRYGGDEFIAVLPNTSPDQALGLAHELRTRMDVSGFRRPNDDRVVPVTLSFGIASFPGDSQNRHELLTIADSNLYSAKSSDERIAATTESQRTNRQLRSEGSFGMLDALVSAVDNKDRYTRRHSEDVTEYAMWIAEEMALSEETLRQIRMGSLLHDVGKIGVPDEILRKPGRLTPEEYEVLQRHPWIGALIVSAVPGMEGIADAVGSHHERWDGQGYPRQLRGHEIPLVGRIVAIGDAFSAMTTDRAYRRALTWETAMQEIRANKGTQFDPALVDVFLRVAQRRMDLEAEQEDTSLPAAA